MASIDDIECPAVVTQDYDYGEYFHDEQSPTSPSDDEDDEVIANTDTTIDVNRPPILGVPSEHRLVIESSMLEDWGITTPRDFQIQAINRAAFINDTVVYIAAKTGSGKSAIPMTVGSLRCGVAIMLVPLIGLGSDQVSKACKFEQNIEAYHLDEHRGDDAHALRTRLESIHPVERDNVTVFLFLSPQSLATNSSWFPTIAHLAKKGYISLYCIDEAHCIEQQGRHFRPEFISAVTNIGVLYKMMPKPCPRIAMSATFRQADQDVVSSLLGTKPDSVFWLGMDRRRICIDVVVSGNPISSIRSSLTNDYNDNHTQKVIIYTNSKKKAEESLVTSCEAVLEKLNIEGEVMPLTGDCGIMQKVFLMAAFCGEASLDSEETKPPLLLIMPATSAANCGVSSNDCHRSYRLNTPPSMYDLVQEMGRVDRNSSQPPGDNRYEVHLSFSGYVSMYLRVMQMTDASERSRNLASTNEVLRFLMLPNDCMHSFMEQYFENPQMCQTKLPCDRYCSFCIGNSAQHTGRFSKQSIVRLLSGAFNGSTITPDGIISIVKSNKTTIFHDDDIPTSHVGPIHALCLQLLAKGIIKLAIADEYTKHIGSFGLMQKHVVVRLGEEIDNSGILGLVLLSDGVWNGLTYY